MDQYIGRLLDNRYEILEVIGTGGMAVVYKARCHRLNRLVAVKILKDEYFRDEEFRRRFHHEGEAVAMLSHPNIVQVYDVSSTDHEDFIVMELIDGITLKQYMEKKGTLNWKETLHFSMQIAKALEHAHGRSIVHRDIKPHNIMVLKNGSVKVTDFGIARVMSKSNTLTKEALGSVHYISPEQAKGGWVDNRSDLYSLGVVMYEMMTGRPPYDGESPVAIAIQHISGGAAMPSSLNPNIPNGLEQIIMRGMALDTNDRYPSATDMLKDMEEFRKDPSVLFLFPHHGVAGETKVLPSAAAVNQAARQQAAAPRTTAEKKAQTAAGAAGAAAAARASAAGNQQRAARESIDPPNLKNSGQQRRTAESAQRLAAAEAAAAAASRRAANRTRYETPARQTREEIREEIREEERNRMATIAVVTCSAVAIIAIVIFLVLLVNGVLFSQDENLVLVDNFVGEYYDSLTNTRGLEIVIGSSRHDENVEKGKILDQRPVSGSKVVPGSKVTVIVSLGPEPQPDSMANLVGRDLQEAKDFLINQGMNPLTTPEFSDTVEAGEVIRTDPVAGSPLEEGQKVEIYYSKGPLIETREMPYVVGMDYDKAYNLLIDLGFDTVTYERKQSDKPKDEVIAQPIKEGEETDITVKIVLTISKGPQTVKREMPNVVGMDYDKAHDKLTDLGFTNVTYESKDSNEPKNEVIEQPFKRGTEVDVTTRIVLTVSRGPKETEEPTEAPAEDVTRKVTIELPTDRTEDYVVSIHYAGKTVVDDQNVKAGTASIDVTLTGSGTQHYDVYINDSYYKTVKVEFN